MNYWDECIAEAFEEAEIIATKNQIDTVVSWAEGAHENYGLATGNDIHTFNRNAAIETGYKEKIEARDAEFRRIQEDDERRLRDQEQRIRIAQNKIYELKTQIDLMERATP